MRELGRGNGTRVVELSEKEAVLLERLHRAVNGGTLWDTPYVKDSGRIDFDLSHALGAVEAWARLRFCVNDLQLEVKLLNRSLQQADKVDATGI